MPAKLNDISVGIPDNVASHDSSPTSPTMDDVVDGNQPSTEIPIPGTKKKKKKKPKKSIKAKEVVSVPLKSPESINSNNRAPILCISRNKHWRYISSYHVRFLLSLSFPY